MRVIILFLLASAAMAGEAKINALVDGAGNVVALSANTLPVIEGSTPVAAVTMERGVARLFDKDGRALWRVTDGKLVMQSPADLAGVKPPEVVALKLDNLIIASQRAATLDTLLKKHPDDKIIQDAKAAADAEEDRLYTELSE